MIAWSPSLGQGTLDYEPDGGTFTSGGATRTFQWSRLATGKPGKRPTRKAERAEWDEWLTFTTRDGETMLFRRGGPPVEASK